MNSLTNKARLDSPIQVEVLRGNALATAGDVLVIKYAQERYGLDEKVQTMFNAAGRRLPKPSKGESALVKGVKGINADKVLVVGTPDLLNFDYPDIRNFGRLALSSSAMVAAPVGRVIMTIHGAGFGLDTIESLNHEIAGLQSAVRSGQFPSSLARISILENDPSEAKILQGCLSQLLPTGTMVPARTAFRAYKSMPMEAMGSDAPMRVAKKKVVKKKTTKKKAAVPATAKGKKPASKPRSKKKEHVFVVMPYSMDKLYRGIRPGVHAAGFACERADTHPFTGYVFERIRHRIKSAAFVVAILTGANPNVYLEVGYAWGCKTRFVLSARSKGDIRSNLDGQKCIFYDNIQDLKKKLARELKGLKKG